MRRIVYTRYTRTTVPNVQGRGAEQAFSPKFEQLCFLH